MKMMLPTKLEDTDKNIEMLHAAGARIFEIIDNLEDIVPGFGLQVTQQTIIFDFTDNIDLTVFTLRFPMTHSGKYDGN